MGWSPTVNLHPWVEAVPGTIPYEGIVRLPVSPGNDCLLKEKDHVIIMMIFHQLVRCHLR